MFNEEFGDFWGAAGDPHTEAIVCTINTVVRKDSTLTMGAGIAKEFAEEFEWLADRWGRRTKEMGERTYPLVERDRGIYIVGLHTKLDWKDPSPISLVQRSIKQLIIIAHSMNWHRVVMTRPGCGNGGLDWARVVKPWLSDVLDKRFVIVER